MKVRFSTIDEFLDELAKDAQIVEHDILRVTKQYQSTQTMPLMHLSVVAGVIIRAQIVELCEFCGQVVGGPHDDEVNRKAEERADSLVARITAAAERLGLEVRAGVFEA